MRNWRYEFEFQLGALRSLTRTYESISSDIYGLTVNLKKLLIPYSIVKINFSYNVEILADCWDMKTKQGPFLHIALNQDETQ